MKIKYCCDYCCSQFDDKETCEKHEALAHYVKELYTPCHVCKFIKRQKIPYSLGDSSYSCDNPKSPYYKEHRGFLTSHQKQACGLFEKRIEEN